MTYKMKAKETGRLYSSRGRTKVICTGPGLTGEMFSGFVVAQSDPESGHPVGHYSTTWTKGAFEEGEGEETFNLDDSGSSPSPSGRGATGATKATGPSGRVGTWRGCFGTKVEIDGNEYAFSAGSEEELDRLVEDKRNELRSEKRDTRIDDIVK